MVSHETRMPPSRVSPALSLLHGDSSAVLLYFLHHADGHAGEDLDAAQHHGADHDGHGVVQRREEAGQLKGAGRVNDLAQLGDEVPEKAAGESAENKGHDAAPQDQFDKAPFALRRSCLFQVQQRQKDHQKAVAHVRHHHAVEEDEEGGHQGVGVHAAVGRQGIHVGYGVQGADHGAALELDRNLGIFLRGGIRQLIGAAEAVQQLRQGLFLLGRGPAFQEEGLFGVHEPLLIELLLDLLHHAVMAQLELQTALLQAAMDSFRLSHCCWRPCR